MISRQPCGTKSIPHAHFLVFRMTTKRGSKKANVNAFLKNILRRIFYAILDGKMFAVNV